MYIAALAPDETETSQSEQETFLATDVFSHIEIADGRIWLLRDGINCFAGDLTEEEKELTWATAMAPVAELFTQKVEGVAWRSKPSWYEVESSHVPMLSHPDLVLDVIRTAANALEESRATA